MNRSGGASRVALLLSLASFWVGPQSAHGTPSKTEVQAFVPVQKSAEGTAQEPGETPDQQPGAPDAVPGSQLRVALLTIGQGDAVWERFGHNALWIQDEATGWGAAFNWGMFDFGQVDFVPRLARGTMLYRLAALDPAQSIEDYRLHNRKVWLQELALTPAQKQELLAFVQWNAQPENMWYRYDYYRDNCSTRVRDALDDVLGGSLRQVAEADTTSFSYRWHTRRLLRDVPAAYLGIQFVLGPSADVPLTGWEEMFLPLRLRDWVREVEVSDGRGGTVPLVAQERVLVESSRLPEPSRPPFALPLFLVVGILWGGGLLLLARSRGAEGWAGRLATTLLGGGWVLVAGLAGTLLSAAWAFTDHTFWYGNYNLLQANPLFLPLLVAFGVFLFRGRFPQWGVYLALGITLVSLAGAALELVPGLGEANGEILAATLPLNLSLGLTALRLGRGTPGPGPAGVQGQGE